MLDKPTIRNLAMTLLAAIVVLCFGATFAQWPPQPPPTTPPKKPPAEQPQKTPPRPQPPRQESPGSSGRDFSDAIGRFRVALPPGAAPSSATYNFAIAGAMIQVNIMSVSQDAMFQMTMQNFPAMLQQIGGRIDSSQPSDVQGRPAQFVAATARDPQSGTPMHSVNLFVPGPNVWIQVMGPEQSAQQLVQVLQATAAGIQFK